MPIFGEFITSSLQPPIWQVDASDDVAMCSPGLARASMDVMSSIRVASVASCAVGIRWKVFQHKKDLGQLFEISKGVFASLGIQPSFNSFDHWVIQPSFNHHWGWITINCNHHELTIMAPIGDSPSSTIIGDELGVHQNCGPPHRWCAQTPRPMDGSGPARIQGAHHELPQQRLRRKMGTQLAWNSRKWGYSTTKRKWRHDVYIYYIILYNDI